MLDRFTLRALMANISLAAGEEHPALSVREVGARRGVCTSTIWRLCNEGKLAHARVSNAIRGEACALEARSFGGLASCGGEPFWRAGVE